MKAKWIIVIAVVIIGGIVGILALGLGPRGNVDEKPIIPVDENGNYQDVPIGEVFQVEPGIVMDKAVAPAYFEFGSVVPGGLVDTWTSKGSISLGEERISYSKGERLWILVYNGKDTPGTFTLGVINAPREVNHSDITGKDYSRAPEDFLDNVDMNYSVTLEGNSAVKVPLSIQFPEGLEYPENWEFRVLVTAREVPGLVSIGLEVRFFITMR